LRNDLKKLPKNRLQVLDLAERKMKRQYVKQVPMELQKKFGLSIDRDDF